MGKGTDKLFITHSEWSSDAAYSASAGAGLAASRKADTAFKNLPFNFCAISLQPFTTPVVTADGSATFDIDNILPWLSTHGTNPVTGSALSVKDLVRLKFKKNDAGEFVDPVTHKVLTQHTHIVAIRPSGNVFAWDTVNRLNVKHKSWNDLVSDESFTKADIITIADPHDTTTRNVAIFKHIKEQAVTTTKKQQQERAAGVNAKALGNAARVLQSESRNENSSSHRPPTERIQIDVGSPIISSTNGPSATSSSVLTHTATQRSTMTHKPSALHTTGRAAASLTSTGLTPETSSALAELSQEDYLLAPKRVKQNGYATLKTNRGPITFELITEQAPRAVYNFVNLAKRKYYDGVIFHRNIRHFMLQGGDPTGTGRGGESFWGKSRPFKDEWMRSSLSHNDRGIVSMANKGRDTNTSQFFIAYRQCKHLDRKHTIFARMVDGQEGLGSSERTLSAIENEAVSEPDNRPLEDVVIENINVWLDPFDEFLKGEHSAAELEQQKEEIKRNGGTEDENTTWTGKKISRNQNGNSTTLDEVNVGKYLARKSTDPKNPSSNAWTAQDDYEPKTKKPKINGASLGNFDAW